MDIKLKEFFYLPNLLSLIRLILIIPIAFLMPDNQPSTQNLVLILALIAACTDFLDGYFSRKLNLVTDLGKILDPLADKIVLGVGLILLVLYRNFPLPLAIYLIYRDIMIVIVGGITAKKTGHPTPANFWGKLNTTVIALTGLLYLSGWLPGLAKLGIILSYGTITASGISYALLGQKLLFDKNWQKTIYWLILVILTTLVILSTINLKFV